MKTIFEALSGASILLGIFIWTTPHNMIFGIISCLMILSGIDYRINLKKLEK